MRDTRSSGWKIWSLLLVFGLILGACGGGDDDPEDAGQDPDAAEQQPGGTVLLAGEQEPTALNWLTSSDNAAWTQYAMQWVWPGTAYMDPAGDRVTNEDLVTSVELTSEEPQTVVYKIHEDAVWQDGKPITADDFIYYWEAQNGKNEAYSPAGTTGYEDIESVVGSDGGKTVTVTFAKQFADWEALFDYILPVHAFTAAGGGDKVKGFAEGFKVETMDLANVISGGPYKVTDYKKGQSMTLERNENYWGKPAFLEKIVIPWITDGTQQPAALENNEADVAFPQAQLDLLQQIRQIQGIEHEVGFGTFWEHLDFNFENKHLGDVKVREAFALALDRPQIIERLPGQFSSDAKMLNNRIYKPGHKDYKDNGKKYTKADPAAAKKRLEEAGYTEGSDGIYAKGGDKLTLRIVWRDPNPRRQQTAELVQAQLKKAGFDIQLAPQPNFNFLDEGNFDIALFGWTGGTVLSSNTSIYVPGGGQNYSKNTNPKIQELFDEANVELNPEDRADLMNEIDQVLWADLPTIPLFQVPELLAWRETIIGPAYNGYIGPTWNAHQWSLEQ